MISLPYDSDFLLPQMCRYSLVFLIALNFFHGNLTFQPFIKISGLLSSVNSNSNPLKTILHTQIGDNIL